jgi:hypothetical protein
VRRRPYDDWPHLLIFVVALVGCMTVFLTLMTWMGGV